MNGLGLHFQTIGIAELSKHTMQESLTEIAKIGYDGVEFAGFKGWTPQELRKLLDDLGLVCIGNHFRPVEEVFQDTERTIEAALALGMKAVGLPGLGIPTGQYSSEAIDALLGDLRRVIRQCKQAGLEVYMHPGMDFYDKNARGQCFTDEVFEKVPELCAQIDTIWCLLGGQDPVAYIEKYAGRELTVHYKDLTQIVLEKSGAGAPGTLPERYAYAIHFGDTPAGTGIQNWPAIVHATLSCGATDVIIEQMGDASKESRAHTLQIARTAHDAVRSLISK